MAVATRNRRSRWRWLAAGIVLGGIITWLVAASTDLSEVADLLTSGIDWRLLSVAALAYALFFMVKALRWRLLLRPVAEVPLLRLAAYVLAGYAGNVLLPLQAGDMARGYLLAKRQEVSPAAVLSGIALEKLLDFVALLVLLAAALWMTESTSPVVETVALVLAAAISLAGILLAVALFRPGSTLAVAERALGHAPRSVGARFGPLLGEALEGLGALRRRSLFAAVLAASLILWALMLGALWAAAAAVAVEVPLAVAVFVLVLAAVGLALPTTPGFVGTLQGAFVLGMVPFGITQEAAVAASLVYQGLTTVPPLIVGGLCWIWLQIAPFSSVASERCD